MQFKQLIYTSNLENILMQVDGVRSVNYTTITQDFDFNAESAEEPVFSPGLFNIVINSDDTTIFNNYYH